MKLCQTLLGDIFFRTLGHRWEYTHGALYLVRRCQKCGLAQHALRSRDRIAQDAYRWHDGEPPTSGATLRELLDEMSAAEA